MLFRRVAAFALAAVLVLPAADVFAQGSMSGAASSSSNLLASGLASLGHARFAEAERDLTAATKGERAAEAWLGLGRVYLLTGRYPEAVRAAESASRGSDPTRLEAAELKARALAAQGKMAEAIAAAKSVENVDEARRARLALGELLVMTGRSADARAPLMTLIRDYNDDRIRSSDGESLALVGRASHLLRSARDANDAYNEAEKAGCKSVEMLLWRADLFLEKYDPGHAEQVVKEALKIAPDHPDALVKLAEVKLDQSLDFDAAEKAIKRALAINPRHTGAFLVRAGLALRDFDLAAANAAVDAGLQVNPVDLRLLSMRAAIRLLADDTAGFDVARKRVLQLNPEFSEMYQIIGEFAEWEHRYPEIVAMMQDAVQVNDKDGKAWAVLGLNLIRLGDEDAGVEALRKSWKYDKFNVRAYNTLNLYERDVPATYETVLLGHFRFRFDKAERAMLERYVPRMLEDAFARMVQHYGFTPSFPIGIELYSNEEHFSVRTAGLPHVGIQGVCFGRTLAASSPKGEAFNWGNVLWHELAHVFAIQQSRSHVPRWFTEGLSEYETLVVRPEWQREEDVGLYAALRANRIPRVASFNRAFTHADRGEDVTMAYYAASQILVFIGQRWGWSKISQMLTLWGQGLRDPEVVQRALGIDMNTLDTQFRAWLAPRLQRYDGQFVPDLRAPAYDDAVAASKAAPGDVRKQIDLCIAAAADGKLDEARAALEAARRLQPADPTVRYLSARFLAEDGDLDGARAVYETMIRDHQDGYAVRMRLADIAEKKKDTKALRAQLQAARRFDPQQIEPLQALYDLAKKENRPAEMLSTLRELSLLDQHNRRVYSMLLDRLAKHGAWPELVRVGARAIFLDVHNPKVHRLYGQALGKSGRPDEALFELESALVAQPDDQEASAVWAAIAEVRKSIGQDEQARSAASRALELDPNNAEAKAFMRVHEAGHPAGHTRTRP